MAILKKSTSSIKLEDIARMQVYGSRYARVETSCVYYRKFK